MSADDLEILVRQDGEVKCSISMESLREGEKARDKRRSRATDLTGPQKFLFASAVLRHWAKL